MKVLLTTLNAKYIHLNLAVRLLYSLHKEREGIAWREFTIKEKPEDIALRCKDYEIVAFSCYIWNITQTLAVAREIKKLNPTCKIMLGGPEVSYEYDELMGLPEVDFIITGEGEIPFAEFLKHYPDLKQVPNLVYKEEGKVLYHPQQVTFDLNLYQGINPYIHDNPEDLLNKVAYIETSRGCPYKCEFCLASLDNKVRYLPMEDIKSNLMYLMQHGKVIKFLDRTFNVKRDFTIDMFGFILEHHKPGNVFQFEITADIVHPDIISYINEHVPKGLFRFEIGIQTVNQQANLQVSRKQNFEKTAGVIRQLDHKIEMHLDLIVGLPLDYMSDIRFSFESVFRLYPPELQLGFLKFLRGTPVRLKHELHGYKYDPMPPYQIIESNYLSKEELAQVTLLEEALEVYWNKKRTVHALRYIDTHYSIFDFLSGLGSFFAARHDFHKHSLMDIYNTAFEFVKLHYADDPIIPQLLAIDYYLQAKIKPQENFVQEVPRSRKIEIISELNLDHHHFRHIIIPISFDFEHYRNTGEVATKQNELVIEYNGTEAPMVKGCQLVLSA